MPGNCEIFNKLLEDDLTGVGGTPNTAKLIQLKNDSGYTDSGIWYPAFITSSSNSVTNSVMSSHGVINNTRLGIENFISFNPSFKNWSTNGSMVVDWILNNHNMPYPVYYGMMFWFKIIDGGFLDGANLWIPDGDVFAFERSDDDNTFYEANSVTHRTYIGTGLYKYYREIHNALTLQEIKTRSKSVKRSRMHKAIAAYLSTSPFVGEFYTNAMNSDTVRGYVNTAIDSGGSLSDIQTCLVDISTHFNTIGLNDKENYQTLTNNYITSNDSLNTKCRNKYGANLVLQNGQSLEYTSTLPNGANIECYELKDHLVPSSVSGSKIFVNQTIDTGYMRVKSQLSSTNTSLLFYGGNEGNSINIPLAEIAKPNLSSLSIIINALSVLTDDPMEVEDGYRIYVPSQDNTIIDINGSQSVDTTVKLKPFIDTPNDFERKSIVDYNGSKLLQFKWEIASGCANFVGTYRMGSGYDNEGSVSNNPFPTLRIQNLGPIVLRLVVNTPFGTVTKSRTLYVVSAGQAAHDSFVSRGTEGSHLVLARGFYRNDENNVVSAPDTSDYYESQPSVLSSNGNMACVCNMVRYAFSDNGVFWPIDTDFYISPSEYIPTGPQRVQSLKNNFKFFLPNINKQSASKYKITFNTTHGASVRVSQIILNCARSNSNVYTDCLSVCRVRMVGLREGRFGYQDIDRGGYSFNKINGELGGTIEVGDSVTIEPRKATTATAPTINAYGGYSSQKKADIGAPVLPDHPDSGAVNSSAVDSFTIVNQVDDDSTTNDKENYKICYQKTVSYGSSIDFHKGLFDPTIGWLPGNTSNKSGVLKFRPGCRETISFIGPGLSEFECSYDSSRLYIRPRTYKSTIKLQIAPEIRPDPYCPGCSPSDSEEETSGYNKFQHERTESITKRAMDQWIRRTSHGYRVLSGGLQKRSEEDSGSAQVDFFQCDEFGFEAGASRSNDNCSSDAQTVLEKMFVYKLWKLGVEDTRFESTPSIYELNDFESYKSFVADNGYRPDGNIYDIRYVSAGIDDLEIKLNLFNILNTKDYAFKLTVNYDDKTADTWAPDPRGKDPRPSAPSSKVPNRFLEGDDAALKAYNMYGDGKDAFFKGTDYKNNLNLDYAGLGDYCKALIDTNSQQSYSYKTLYLMNQEHFCSNIFNTTLVFSDHANKNNVLYNHNRYMKNGVSIHQNIVKSSDQKMLPTLSADGYSESDHIFYRNLIMNNNVTIGNATTSKFHGLTMFQKFYERECCTKYDDSIEFSLEVEVLDEPDLMGSYENTRDGPFLAGFYRANNIPKSDSPFNSICNWEIILHTSPTPKMAPHTTSSIQSMNNSDALGLIEYGRSPRYGGYNFMANLAGKKHLLPTVNMDAPNTYLNDLSLCSTANSSYAAFASQASIPMDFPYAAILRIIVGYAAIVNMGSLVGTLAFIGFTAFDYSAIIDYLGSLTGQINKDDSERNIYAMDFGKYYPGSPEKVLLNVSKDGGIWYKLEASIFKLSNTPALVNNSYDFALLKRDTFPIFSNIQYNTVSSIKQLIDDSYIKNVTINANTSSGSTSTDINAIADTGVGTYGAVDLQQGDIIRVKCPSAALCNGIYVVQESSFDLLEPEDIENIDNYTLNVSSIYDCIAYLSTNSLFSASRGGFFDSFRSDLEDGKIIIVDNEYSFNMFDIGDTVELYSGNRSTVSIINNKAKIIKDNIIKTALVLDSNASGYAYLSPYFEANESSGAATPSGKYKAVIFKANTTVEHDRSVPLNRWSMEKQGIPEKVPNVEKSTISTGSVGDGSLNVNKGIFTNTLRYNKVHNLYDIFNNHENMRIKYNAITFIFDDETTNNATGGSYGYRVAYDDLRQTFANNITFNDSVDDEYRYNTMQNINIADPNKHNYSIMILCFDPAGASMSEDTGKVIIDQDFEHRVVKTISSADRTLAENRIESLEDSIATLENSYTSMEEDPTECHFENPSVRCPKRDTEKSLYAKYHERAKLLEVLDNVYDNTNVTGSVDIRLIENTDGSLSIQEDVIGDDNYWINIDTEQFCSVADEMTPKVLVKTEVLCIPILRLGFVGLPPDHNICPAFGWGNASSNGGYAESFNGNGNAYVYAFDDTAVQAKKSELESQYPSIAGWGKSNRTRIMYAYGDSLDFKTKNASTVIRITEEYEIALPVEETIDSNWHTNPALYNDHTIDIDPSALSGSSGKPLGYIGNEGSHPGKVINIFNLDNTDTLKVNFRRIPRMIRGKDRSGQVQRIDKYGNRYPSPEPSSFGGTLNAGSLMPIDIDITDGNYMINDMYAWHCFRKDKNGKFIPESVPDYFKLLNEMEFRGFFGSEDGLENKSLNIVETLNPEEMVPYEFGEPDTE